jgi:hypothetical protein
MHGEDGDAAGAQHAGNVGDHAKRPVRLVVLHEPSGGLSLAKVKLWAAACPLGKWSQET